MPHLDDDTLTLLALDELEADAGIRAHLQECGRCGTELAELRRVVRAGRSPDAEAPLQRPADQVWDQISAAVTRTQTPAERTDSVRPVAPAGATVASHTGDSRRRATWGSLAAGLVIGALGGGLLATLRGADDQAAPAARVVARAELDALGADGTRGVAELRETSTSRQLTVQLSGGVASSTPQAGFQEVWLLDPDTGRLISLGVLDGSQGTFALPDGLRLGRYPAVDVSVEPFDGDPAHSADSISRGELRTESPRAEA